MTQGGVIALDDEKGGGRSVNYAEKYKKKQSKWHSRAVLGRNKARVRLKTVFRRENVGGPASRGSHFGGKMRPKCVQKRHTKIDQM